MIETDIIQGEIRYRPSDHSYTHIPTGRRLASVSEVISTVYAKKSWDGADPQVVENARERGVAVDRYLSQYIRDGAVTIEDESEDITNRVIVAHRLYEELFGGLLAESQVIVYSLDDMVAGTLDFLVDNCVIADLKNTYNPERSWTLQLGAYATYAPEPVKRAGIIHISPKVYKTGGIWIEYDVEGCKRYWQKAVSWWKDIQTLKTNGPQKRR